MAAEDPTGIDLDDVLRRARRRRRPRLAAAIAGGVVAVAAVATPVVAISLPLTRIVASSGSAGSIASAPDGVAPSKAAGTGVPGDRSVDAAAGRQRCGAPVAPLTSATSGLTLTIAPLEAQAGAAQIPVEVTLTNVGAARFSGSVTASAALTLSRDGIVVWHSNGPAPLVALPIDLDPGASTTLPATLQPVICGPQDETSAGFRSDLPSAAAGGYEVIATLKVVPADDAGRPGFLTSAPTTLTLR